MIHRTSGRLPNFFFDAGEPIVEKKRYDVNELMISFVKTSPIRFLYMLTGV